MAILLRDADISVVIRAEQLVLGSNGLTRILIAAAKNIGIMFGAIAACLVALEAFIAVADLAPRQVYYWKLNPRGITEEHNTKAYRVSYTTNLQGLREQRLLSEQHDGRVRIALIGGSSVYGWGLPLEESPPKILETLIRREMKNDRVEVINLSVPGTDPQNFMRYAYQYAIPKLAADIILVEIHETRNSFNLAGTYSGSNGETGPISAELFNQTYQNFVSAATQQDEDPEKSVRESVAWRSGLFRLIYRARNQIDYRYFGTEWPGISHTIVPPTLQLSLIPERVALAKAEFEYVVDQLGDRQETRQTRLDEVRLAVKVLAQIQQWATGRNIEFAAVIVPMYWALLEPSAINLSDESLQHDDMWRFKLILEGAKIERRENALLSTTMDDFFSAACVEFKVRCFNLADDMRRAVVGLSPGQISRDDHYRPAANQAEAQAIISRIRPMMADALARQR